MLGGVLAHAAPIPGTSTSALISEKPELFRSAHGFQLDAADTSWYLQNSKTSSEHLETIYKSPKLSQGLQASLTVRVDQRNPHESFKLYLKRSLKDYERLGLEVLRTRPVKINHVTGFLVDALGQNKEKQIRQLVFGKGQTMVILTCRDGKTNFQKSVKDCNEIFKTFQWL
jgi:hypothetical protein